MPAECFKAGFLSRKEGPLRQCPSASFQKKVDINAPIFSMLFQSSLCIIIPMSIFIPLSKRSGGRHDSSWKLSTN